jgi:hypothetical protein
MLFARYCNKENEVGGAYDKLVEVRNLQQF